LVLKGIEKKWGLCYFDIMAKNKKINRKQKPDINEIAFRVVQESTSEDRASNPNKPKTELPFPKSIRK